MSKLRLSAVIVLFCFIGFTGCRSERNLSEDNSVTGDNYMEESGEEEALKNRFQEIPELYGEVILQYKSAWEEDKIPNTGYSVEKFHEGGEWEYVDFPLYVNGKDSGIYFSLFDLTNDGFPELIMGMWKDDFCKPYALYYYNEEKDEIESKSYGGQDIIYYENGVTLSIWGGVKEPMQFSQFQADTKRWEVVAGVGKQWLDGEFTGYYKDGVEGVGEVAISEEEYHQIINQYAVAPIELEWFPLDLEQVSYGQREAALESVDAGITHEIGAEEVTLEDVNYHFEDMDLDSRYFCLEADNPIVREMIADGWDSGFSGRVFIKGLAGYTPKSDIAGNLDGYTRDREILVEKNVGRGLLQSERLAEVQENIREMMMDIIRERGGKVGDYQEYFADEVIWQEIVDFLNTEIEEDWLLLESFYLSDYAGNAEEISWFHKYETTWKDEENEITYRMAETDTMYHFAFYFYADYRTMGYAEDEEAAQIDFTCAVSKETGLIEEISISKWYQTKYEFETGRW